MVVSFLLQTAETNGLSCHDLQRETAHQKTSVQYMMIPRESSRADWHLSAIRLLSYQISRVFRLGTMITITESAQEYLAELLSKQEDALGVRVFINDPGTPRAETCIAYCRDGDVESGDIEQAFDRFTAWFQGRSIPFLEDALVDYSPDRMGGQLTIKAPNAKMPRVSDDSPIEDRINYVLYNEINPSLAAHGGEVSLIEVTEDQFAVLRFGGGCQGCSAVDMTLKGGVEKTLLEQIPQLAGVRDTTDHSDRSQAYY